MRNLTYFLTLVVGALIAFFVVLPILGFALVVVLVLAVLAVLAYLALPWLVKLPWFRDRIHVQRHGLGRTVRFGKEAANPHGTAHRDWQQPQEGEVGRRLDDVIDVEGREIPDRD